jgi:ubiquinone/menaquinone biosynthesis C-methylase UbiE
VTAVLEHSLSPVVPWLDETGLGSVYSSRSWNDLTEEQTKEWWIADGSETSRVRLRRYLDESGLMEEFRIAERHLTQLPNRGLAVADLAAGIGWTSSLMSKLPNVASVHAVDISRHRLELLFPQAVRMFAGDPGKLTRHLGSFYELGFANASMDVVLMSASFPHASSPLRLLMEIDRVLKPGGQLLLIGENFIGPVAIGRRFLKVLLLERRLCTDFHELFPPDDQWGDHYYRVGDYHLFMRLLGYRVLRFSVQRRQTATIISEKLTQ